MKITMGGKYQTRDGRAVRILCVDSGLDYPIVGIVIGDAHPETWTAEGILSYNHAATGKDLIPVPTKAEMWAVVYAVGDYCTAVKDRFPFSTEAFARGAEDEENGSHPSLTHDRAYVASVIWTPSIDPTNTAPANPDTPINEAWMAITNYGLPSHAPFQAMGSWLYGTLGEAKVAATRIGGIVAHVTWED